MLIGLTVAFGVVLIVCLAAIIVQKDRIDKQKAEIVRLNQRNDALGWDVKRWEELAGAAQADLKRMHDEGHPAGRLAEALRISDAKLAQAEKDLASRDRIIRETHEATERMVKANEVQRERWRQELGAARASEAALSLDNKKLKQEWVAMQSAARDAEARRMQIQQRVANAEFNVNKAQAILAGGEDDDEEVTETDEDDADEPGPANLHEVVGKYYDSLRAEVTEELRKLENEIKAIAEVPKKFNANAMYDFEKRVKDVETMLKGVTSRLDGMDRVKGEYDAAARWNADLQKMLAEWRAKNPPEICLPPGRA